MFAHLLLKMAHSRFHASEPDNRPRSYLGVSDSLWAFGKKAKLLSEEWDALRRVWGDQFSSAEWHIHPAVRTIQLVEVLGTALANAGVTPEDFNGSCSLSLTCNEVRDIKNLGDNPDVSRFDFDGGYSHVKEKLSV